MAKLKFRYAAVTILLAMTAFSVNALQYTYTPNDQSGLTNLKTIPMRIGTVWQGREFPLEEKVYDILETRAIIHRSFTGPQDQKLFLSIVHYADTKVDFHAPEACLGGQGLKVNKVNKTIQLMQKNDTINIDIAELSSFSETNHSLTYYFYKSGDFLGSNYIKMRLNVAANKLLKNDSSGSLIRISTSYQSANEKPQADSTLRHFLQDIYPYLLEIR